MVSFGGGVPDIDLTERWNVSEARKTSKNVNPFHLSAQMRIHSHASQFWFSSPNLWLGTFTSAGSTSKDESFIILFGSFDLFLIANSGTQPRISVSGREICTQRLMYSAPRQARRAGHRSQFWDPVPGIGLGVDYHSRTSSSEAFWDWGWGGW